MSGRAWDLGEIFRRADAADILLERLRVTTQLAVSDQIEVNALREPALVSPSERIRLESEGHLVVDEVASAEEVHDLSRAIDAVVADGLPPVFVYLGDLLWTLGDRLCSRVSSLLGHRYDLIEDAWAWRIEPGARGWLPHRGWSARVFDRRAPELLNAWLALGDVPADRACIHAIPLADDPHYPARLDRVDAPLECVTALPLRAGSVACWNANLLHWGGPCARHSLARRYSASFSLVRRDARDPALGSLVELATLDPARRLDLIAAQIATYGSGKTEVSDAVLHWARAATLLARSRPA